MVSHPQGIFGRRLKVSQLSTAFLLAGLATPLLFASGKGLWIPGLWTGVAWGLANFLCMAQVTRVIVEGRRGWRLAGWVALKVLGLYGILAWLLLGVRVSPLGWLTGFTLSLIGAGLNALGSLRSVASTARQAVIPLLLILTSSSAAMAAEAAHGAGAAAPAHPPEIPNLITLITQALGHGPVSEFLHTWENSIYAVVISLLVGGLVAFATRRLTMRPGRGQMLAETVIEGLDNLVCGVLGRQEGRRYLPFLGTLFLYILAMNLAGLVPGLKSPTSRFEMTGALGLTVFCFVQWTGIRRLGLLGYVDHLIGQPRDLVGWILSPLMLFIHGIGEIVKPLSLSLRLFGNIMGEDTLLGVFVALGALSFAWSHLPIGVPLHLPFILLAIIFSVVQALVFTSLSMIYIYMMLPHEEHAHAGSEQGAH